MTILFYIIASLFISSFLFLLALASLDVLIVIKESIQKWKK